MTLRMNPLRMQRSHTDTARDQHYYIHGIKPLSNYADENLADLTKAMEHANQATGRCMFIDKPAYNSDMSELTGYFTMCMHIGEGDTGAWWKMYDAFCEEHSILSYAEGGIKDRLALDFDGDSMVFKPFQKQKRRKTVKKNTIRDKRKQQRQAKRINR